MSDFDRVLGLPLEKALAILKTEGLSPAVEITYPPREPDKKGTLRVVNICDDGQRIVVAAFNDAIPARV
jgi:hypothetical protein